MSETEPVLNIIKVTTRDNLKYVVGVIDSIRVKFSSTDCTGGYLIPCKHKIVDVGLLAVIDILVQLDAYLLKCGDKETPQREVTTGGIVIEEG